jgi:hypothetical protein
MIASLNLHLSVCGQYAKTITMEASLLDRPQQEERLANIVEQKTLRKRLSLFNAQRAARRSAIIAEVLSLLLLFGLSLWLLLPFFNQADFANTFSAPLLPVLSSVISFIVPYQLAIRLWLLVLMLIFPICFYYLIREITSRRLAAVAAALTSVLPISVFMPLRLESALFDGDGAQMASLTFTVLICLSLLKFLRHGRFSVGVLSSFGIAVVALTSPFGFVVMFCFAIIITFSEMLLGRGRLKFFRFLAIFVFAIGFSAFWYNPKFVFIIISSYEGQQLIRTVINVLPLTFFLVPLLGAFGYLVFENRPQLQPIFLALFLTVIFGLLSLGGAGVYLTTPSRFLPSFGLSVSFLGGVLLAKAVDFLHKPQVFNRYELLRRYGRTISGSMVVMFFCLSFLVYGLRENRIRRESKVLGIQDVKRAGLWEIREQSRGWADIVGGGLTGLTILAVAYISFKVKPVVPAS